MGLPVEVILSLAIGTLGPTAIGVILLAMGGPANSLWPVWWLLASVVWIGVWYLGRWLARHDTAFLLEFLRDTLDAKDMSGLEE